ncbi:MAG: alpha/beta fold hydrolase [Candidatus Thorarchaeota archaeon]
MASPAEGVALRAEGANIAFLLIHGFNSSVDQVASLGEFLESKGIESFAVKLAGHGASPLDLHNSNRKLWIQSALNGLELVKSWNPQHLFIGGLSMGGALALLLSARETGIDGVVALSPAVFEDSLISKFVPILKRVKRYRSLDLSYIPEMYEIPYSKVKEESVSALHEVLKLMKIVQKELPDVNIPAIIIQSGADKTIDPTNGKFAFESISSENKQLHIIEGADHVLTCHSTRFEVFRLIEEFVASIVEPKG